MTKQDLIAFLSRVDDSAEVRIVIDDEDVPLEQVTLCATITHPDMISGTTEGLDPSKYQQGPTYVVLGPKRVSDLPIVRKFE
jgi:hypothetical protein